MAVSESNPAPADTRTAGSLLASWRTLKTVKNDLIKEGVVDGEATTDQVLEALRRLLPAEQFCRE